MQVRVKSLRRTYLLSVPGDAYLTTLKGLLSASDWTDKQFLYQGRVLLEDAALSSFGVSSGSEILIVQSTKPAQTHIVSFTYRKQCFSLRCSEFSSILELRLQCSHKVCCNFDSIHLRYRNETLADALQVGSLGPQPVLDIVIDWKPVNPINSFEIYVRTMTGQTHFLDVNSSTTIRDIKETLADRTDQDTSTMRLIFAGKQLRDEDSIDSVNAGRECTFHLIPRLR